jgi:hypothetical protein
MARKEKPKRYLPMNLDPIKLRTELALLKLKLGTLPWAAKDKPRRHPR